MIFIYIYNDIRFLRCALLVRSGDQSPVLLSCLLALMQRIEEKVFRESIGEYRERKKLRQPKHFDIRIFSSGKC